MDAIKILGELLGNKSMAKGGIAQQILKQILTGGGQQPVAGDSRPPAANTGATAPTGSVPPLMPDFDHPPQSPADLMRGGGSRASDDSSLGGLLRRAVQRHRGDSSPDPTPPKTNNDANQQAQVVIRAMIQAAKSDGRIDASEQKQIVSKLGQLSQDEVDFLQHEFAQPVDPASLARQVPTGMEQQLYAISLTAIDLDSNSEAQYLHELATNLRLSRDVCKQIHAHFGAPQIYS